MFTIDANAWDWKAYKLLSDYEDTGAILGIWLLGLMASESGLDTKAHNPNGNAQGISQCMPAILRALGVDVDTYRDQPASFQMEVTIRYFEEWRKRFKLKKFNSRADLYLVNFLPALLPAATLPDSVLVSKSRSPVIYNANAGLDANKDNQITLNELDISIEHAINGYSKHRYQVALASYAEVRGNPAAVPLPVFTAKDIQTALATHGFDVGPIDGIWGKRTGDALRAFQTANGLVADGIVGPLTEAALRGK